MRSQIHIRSLFLCSLFLVACTGGSGSGSSGTLDLGDEDCVSDSECTTGVCWDYSDYDSLCGGAVCSVTCITDIDCENAFAAASALFPQIATCGADGRCDPIGSGFGTFFCQ